jgi:hypothetical protein
VLSAARAGELGRVWLEGWNRADVDLVMGPFAPEVVFTSPAVARMTGDPSRSSIEGREALRVYVADALARTSDIQYTLEASYVGTDSVVLQYSCGRPGGPSKVGADSMRVDDTGQVVEWRCHYPPGFMG